MGLRTCSIAQAFRGPDEFFNETRYGRTVSRPGHAMPSHRSRRRQSFIILGGAKAVTVRSSR
jgi:hypothetical protein